MAQLFKQIDPNGVRAQQSQISIDLPSLSVCLFVSLRAWERQRERDGEIDREIESETQTEGEKESEGEWSSLVFWADSEGV